MKIGCAGDWHGNTRWARAAVEAFGRNEITDVLHVGDFGLFWPGNRWPQYLNEVDAACHKWGVQIWVTPGNHENYAEMNHRFKENEWKPFHVSENVIVLPRGWRWEWEGRSFVSLGGAPSIDKLSRIEDLTWWKDEFISYAEAVNVHDAGHADVMVAHDVPNGTTDAVERIINDPNAYRYWPDAMLRYCREGRQMMDIAFSGVRPKVYVHGHYHVADEKTVDGTTFISLNCDGVDKNLITLDLDTLEHEWLEI